MFWGKILLMRLTNSLNSMSVTHFGQIDTRWGKCWKVWYGWNTQILVHCPDGSQNLKLSFKATKFVPVFKHNLQLRSPLRPRNRQNSKMKWPPYLNCQIPYCICTNCKLDLSKLPKCPDAIHNLRPPLRPRNRQFQLKLTCYSQQHLHICSRSLVQFSFEYQY